MAGAGHALPTSRTEVTRTTAPWSWRRIVLLALVSVGGVVGASGCAVGWLLTGSVGSPVAWWQPIAYPAGAVVRLAVPVVTGRALLGPVRGPWRWAAAGMVAAGLLTSLLPLVVLGASG